MVKKEKQVKIEKKQLLSVAQEIKFAKVLAGNNKAIREKAIKRLGKWLREKSQCFGVNEDVFIRIWKGLFYAMWMSDKPLLQESCAEDISKLIHFNDVKTSLMFFKCFLKTMVAEWFGLDFYRIDKFQMLVRRMLRHMFEVLKQNDWSMVCVKQFGRVLNATVLNVNISTPVFGLMMHFTEIYLEELAKVSGSNEQPNSDALVVLLEPFAETIGRLKNRHYMDHIITHVFHHLLRQSDAGIDYEQKFQVWKQLGFPGQSADCLVKVNESNGEEIDSDYDEEQEEEEDDNDDNSRSKDIRAGHVDVILPQLRFDPIAIETMLRESRTKPYTNRESRKLLSKIANQFRELGASKQFPLRVKLPMKKLAESERFASRTFDMNASLQRLNEFEEEIGEESARKRKRNIKSKSNQISIVVNDDDDDVECFPEPKKRKRMENGVDLKRKQKQNEKLVKKKKSAMNMFVRNSGVWHVNEYNVSSKELEMKAEPERVEKLNKSVLVKNPFSTEKKKIKFDLNSNKSQDIHEHHAQVFSSPDIPYDSTKKPTKPLLKPSPYRSPINPFYKRKLRL